MRCPRAERYTPHPGSFGHHLTGTTTGPGGAFPGLGQAGAGNACVRARGLCSPVGATVQDRTSCHVPGGDYLPVDYRGISPLKRLARLASVSATKLSASWHRLTVLCRSYGHAYDQAAPNPSLAQNGGTDSGNLGKRRQVSCWVRRVLGCAAALAVLPSVAYGFGPMAMRNWSSGSVQSTQPYTGHGSAAVSARNSAVNAWSGFETCFASSVIPNGWAPITASIGRKCWSPETGVHISTVHPDCRSQAVIDIMRNNPSGASLQYKMLTLPTGWPTSCSENRFIFNERGPIWARSSSIRSSAAFVWDHASAALALASAACLLAFAAVSSDLRFSSFWRSPAICPSLISSATPIAIKLLATDEPHCSQKESYGGCIAAIATSAITPTTTSPPPNHSQRSHDSMDFSNSESLAFIVPFGRRHAGKGFAGFWAGIGVGALIFIVLFAIYFLQ